MQHIIEGLWRAGKLPAWNGLYRADGESRVARLDATRPEGMVLLGPLDLDALLRDDPDWVTAADVTLELKLVDGSGFMCCGEGSHGSDGFICRIDSRKRLVWAVFLEDSDPFIEMVVNGGRVEATSSSGISVSMDLATREFGL
jgi:hypothetical protein